MSSIRYHHLDALRSFCMLFGIFVHAGTLGTFGEWQVTGNVSDYFRMATFFLVSGMLGGLVLQRRPAGAYVRNRLFNLGVPFLAATLLLNPLALWLIFVHHNPGVEASFWDVIAMSFQKDRRYQGPLIWHLHLWFLVSLLVMAACAPLFTKLFSVAKFSQGIARAFDVIPSWGRAITLVLLIVISTLFLRVLVKFFGASLNEVWLVRSTIIYFPFFVAGILIFSQPSLWATVHRFDPLLVCTAFAALASLTLLEPHLTKEISSLLGFIIKTYVRAVAAFTFIAVFDVIASRASRMTTFITGSIYTVYLLHYPLLYINAWFLDKLDMPIDFFYWAIASILTAAMGFAVHVILIERSRILMLLFNGKFSAYAK